MWTYHQKSGDLLHIGVWQGQGYSGRAGGRNNPDAQCTVGVGPLPQGQYRIGTAYDHPQLGPCVMNLDAEPGTNTFGRDLFRIHGDNANHDASHGCIILGPAIRHAIRDSGDHELEVLP